MGTRHLIMAVIDGETKIAQYGQWDGYPDGQGRKVLKFARELPEIRDQFLQNLRETRWLTQEECDAINTTPGPIPDHLSRNAGADILDFVLAEPRRLVDSTDFALDGLFCEWAYVLDFDADKLEVYQGFNKGDQTAGRWAGRRSKDGEYAAVGLMAIFDLNKLPSDKDFVAQLDPADA